MSSNPFKSVKYTTFKLWSILSWLYFICVRGWHLIRSPTALIFCMTTSLLTLILLFLVPQCPTYLHAPTKSSAWWLSLLIINSSAGSYSPRFVSLFITNKYAFYTLICIPHHAVRNAPGMFADSITNHKLVLVLVMWAATPLTLPKHQECIREVRNNRVAQKRPEGTPAMERPEGTPAIDLGHMNVVFKWCMMVADLGIALLWSIVDVYACWDGCVALFLASTVSALHRNAHIWNASHPLLVTYYCWVTVYSPSMEAK